MNDSEQKISITQLRNSWNQFIAGNDSEIGLLYSFYGNRLLLGTFLITKNRNTAEELLMETLLVCQKNKTPFQNDMENFLMKLLKLNYS